MSEQPTEREDRAGPGEPPTIRENRSGRHVEPPTAREVAAPAGASEPPTTRERAAPGGAGALPDDLARAYRQISQHAQPGGEAHIFIVEHLTTGERRVLKLYHRGVSLKPDVLERVRTIDDGHVVRLHDYGQAADGRWYEVQEHVEGPNLVEFRDSSGGRLAEPLLRVVIRELHQAVSAFHAAGLVHRDIKPENILVRHAEPLDLILIDFGLSVVAEGTTVFLSGRDATYNYQAPEVLARQTGPAADRWSMGMTVAMLATGETPYAGMSMYAIHRQHLDHVPAPLVDEIGDDRIRALCRGLTRYNEDHRWGTEQVDAWLGGADPAVVEDGPAPVSGPSVTFNTVDYTDRRELAHALLASPAVATSVLKTAARRDAFVDDVLSAFGGERIAELEQRWSARAPRPQEAIAEVVVALDPDTNPTYRGHSLSPAELALLAHQAGQGDTNSRAVVAELAGSRILAAWGRGAIHPELGTVETRWRAARESFANATKAAVAAGASEVADNRADALILAALLDDKYAAELIRRRNRARPGWLTGQHWYLGISRAGTDDLGAVVAGFVYAAEAERLSNEQRDRAADQAREQRRERSARRRSRWAGNRITRLRRLQFGALVVVAIAAFLEHDLAGFIGWLTDSPVASVGVNIWDLYLRPDWFALVLGIIMTLILRTVAGSGMGYELAAMLGVAGGLLYTGGAIGTAIELRHSFAVTVFLYAAASLACAWAATDAWFGRTAYERDRSNGNISLRDSDRTILRRTLVATLTLVVPGLIGLAWVWHDLNGVPFEGSLEHLTRASTGDMLVAFVTKGLWVPLAVGALLLLLRGNWNRRSYGMKAAAALTAATVIAYTYGTAQSEEAIERTREAFTTTPIPEPAIDSGFCGRVGTGANLPSRAAIAGPGCHEIHRSYG